MKKILIGLLFMFYANLVFAVPNFWLSHSHMGGTEFNLINEKNQAISFSCQNNDDNTESVEPSFSYIANWDKLGEEGDLSADDKNNLSLLIDDKYVVFPHSHHWSEFLKKISVARKIIIYTNNQELAEFKPQKNSIYETAKYIPNACQYELWR